MNELDYNNDIKIDHDYLDMEWLKQPNLLMQYSEANAEAKKQVEDIKEQIEILKAKLSLNIRKNPNKYGIKITESGINDVVNSNRKMIRLRKNLNEAKYNYDILSFAVKAIDTKKTALENLVKLLGMNYFSSPKEPHELNELYNQKQVTKRVSEKRINSRLNKRR